MIVMHTTVKQMVVVAMIEVLAMSKTRHFVELKITTEAQMYDSAFLLSYILHLLKIVPQLP